MTVSSLQQYRIVFLKFDRKDFTVHCARFIHLLMTNSMSNLIFQSKYRITSLKSFENISRGSPNLLGNILRKIILSPNKNELRHDKQDSSRGRYSTNHSTTSFNRKN